MSALESTIKEGKIPRHVAIIMDGNGRWANQKGLNRLEGHRQGAKNAIEIMKYCRKLGVEYLTLYTFSSENWRRPSTEVDGLMEILYHYLSKESQYLIENEAALHVIGDLKKLPQHIQGAIQLLQQETAHFTKSHLILALSYGARDEIARAVRQISRAVKNDVYQEEDITEELISAHLDTRGIPDPDMVIRTGAEKRLSNFLLWQASYAEIFMLDTPWPAFSPQDLDNIFTTYSQIQRRYGMTPEQTEKVGEAL